MNILSLFDGMSCGMLALQRAGIKVDNYFASEIDKYAIQVSQKNFPDIKHIGDVTKVRGIKKERTKVNESDIYEGSIDLLIGGSPCQGFSFAGKQLNFDDHRSKLFFEYVRILKEVKPKYFLLENVNMKKEYQNIISEYLGVQPIEINSLLVSTQNRKRLYWTNIPGIQQPKDKKIYLKDIIEFGYYNGEQCIDGIVRKIITEKVKVRKYIVNIDGLKKILREHKNISINNISLKLNKPKTLVEHWFRNDNSFAIPSEDIRLELKKSIKYKYKGIG